MKCCRPISASAHHISLALWISVLALVLLAAAPQPAHAYTALSDGFLRLVPSGGDDFDPTRGSLLSPLLTTPRVPGTSGHAQAQHHFLRYFQTELPRWTVEWHNSSAPTPKSSGRPVPFSNLVFRREPPWTRPGQTNFLTFAAHYDSRAGSVGATDGAAACAMLLHIARSLDAYAQQMHDEMAELGEGGTVPMDMGVQIVLLDGKQGFGTQPSDSDSLYGSRSLAASWEATTNPAMTDYGYPNALNQISLLVQLDRLGAANPRVGSSFQSTHWAYQRLATIEARMRGLHLLESRPPTPFLPDSAAARFAPAAAVPRDDHAPFSERGVEVLRVVPSSSTNGFPEQQQQQPGVATTTDDTAHLDVAAVRDWSRIMTAFAFEWLDMMEVAPAGAKEGERLRRRHERRARARSSSR